MLRSLVPWSGRFPKSLARMDDDMDGLMGRLLKLEEDWWRPGEFLPKIDLSETETGFEVSVDLPGLKPEDVNVELKNGSLWVSGERKEEQEEKGKTFHRVERHYGEFRRVLPLPTNVNEEQVEAKFSDGVLKIVVPKSEEAKTKHIEVKS